MPVDDGVDRPIKSCSLGCLFPARVMRWLNRPKQRRAVVSASRSVCVAKGKMSLESYLGMAVGWMRKSTMGSELQSVQRCWTDWARGAVQLQHQECPEASEQ